MSSVEKTRDVAKALCAAATVAAANVPGKRPVRIGDIAPLQKTAQRKAPGEGRANSGPESSYMDVTTCVMDDGSQAVVTILDGRVALNGTPVTVDDRGFITGLDGSLLSIRYQDMYRRAMDERASRMRDALGITREGEHNSSHDNRCSHGNDSSANTLRQQTPLGGDGYKQSMPDTVKKLANDLSVKIDNLEGTLRTYMKSVAPKPPPASSPRPRFSLRNFLHSLRHRHAQLLMENEQVAEDCDHHADLLIRGMYDAQSRARELLRGSYQLSEGYDNLQKDAQNADLDVWALVKTVHSFCAEALAREQGEYLARQSRDLQEKLEALEVKEHDECMQIQQLEKKNQRLLEEVVILSKEVDDMRKSIRTRDDNTREMIVPTEIKIDFHSHTPSLSPPSSPLCTNGNAPTKEINSESHQTESASKQNKECNCSQDGKTKEPCNDCQNTIRSQPRKSIDIAQQCTNAHCLVPDRGRLQRFQNDPTASWFDVQTAHNQYWRGVRDISDDDKTNFSALHRLGVECSAIHDQNQVLVRRLDQSQADSTKRHDQIHALLDERQRLKQRLNASQTLLDIAQKSMVSQSESE